MGIVKQRIVQTTGYMRRNGVKNTVFAVCERLFDAPNETYSYSEPLETDLARQRVRQYENPVKVSIVVPAYKTSDRFFTELIESVVAQTYPYWELVIGDVVSECSESHRKIVESFNDERIVYFDIDTNYGISENTNITMGRATGEYIGLLDHDDVLTPDALYYMVKCLNRNINKDPILIYSDEDKTDAELKSFYEPHRKRKLNLDLILSNNYICHFTMIKADVIKELKFRKEYDGAQDYDMFLRCIAMDIYGERIFHVPKILYHWRCHENSTASNVNSKDYAYDSGRRAVLDFCNNNNWKVSVEETMHKGFHRLEYLPDIFANRKSVGAVCGPVYAHGKVLSGVLMADGTCPYKGLNRHYSGYMHRASLMQKTFAGDIRNIVVRDELSSFFKDVTEGLSETSDEKEIIEASIRFASGIRERGYYIVYDPQLKGVSL